MNLDFWKLLPWALLILTIGGVSIYLVKTGVDWGTDKTEMTQDKEQVATDKVIINEQTVIRNDLPKRTPADKQRILDGWVRD